MEQLIHIDPGGAPIYEQLFSQIVQLAAAGILQEGDQLVSVRTLARTLGVNPNTVQKAYADLERAGITYSVPGKGSFIAAPGAVRENLRREAEEKLAEALAACRRAGFDGAELRALTEKMISEGEERVK